MIFYRNFLAQKNNFVSNKRVYFDLILFFTFEKYGFVVFIKQFYAFQLIIQKYKKSYFVYIFID